MKKIISTTPALRSCATLVVLLAALTVHADTRSTLTTEQIIQQTEAQFNGRVSSLSSVDNSQSYQVRLLTRKGKLLVIVVDATTGKMHEASPAELKTKSTVIISPIKNQTGQ